LDGDPADPGEFEGPAIDRETRRALMQRVELCVDAECEAVYPERFGCRIELRLRDGRTLRSATLDPHGTAADPCTREEIVAKFTRLAGLSSVQIDARAVLDAVSRLDTAASVDALTRALRP
jgi:2-methylcitrate dehydratase PrpD